MVGNIGGTAEQIIEELTTFAELDIELQNQFIEFLDGLLDQSHQRKLKPSA